MRITVSSTFKHGRDRFVQGDTRTVSDEDGHYFIAHGWAVAAGEPPVAPPSVPPVTLDPQNILITQGVQNG